MKDNFNKKLFDSFPEWRQVMVEQCADISDKE